MACSRGSRGPLTAFASAAAAAVIRFDEMKTCVDARVAARRRGNASEHMRDLIQRDSARKQVRAAILAGMNQDCTREDREGCEEKATLRLRQMARPSHRLLRHASRADPSAVAQSGLGLRGQKALEALQAEPSSPSRRRLSCWMLPPVSLAGPVRSYRSHANAD